MTILETNQTHSKNDPEQHERSFRRSSHWPEGQGLWENRLPATGCSDGRN